MKHHIVGPYRIELGAAYHDDIGRWMASGVIRNAAVAGGHAEPVVTRDVFMTEADAVSACTARAEAMLRNHPRDGNLEALDRERQWHATLRRNQ